MAILAVRRAPGFGLRVWIWGSSRRNRSSEVGYKMKSLAFREEGLGVIRFHVDGLGVLDGELGVSASAALAVIGFGLRIRVWRRWFHVGDPRVPRRSSRGFDED